MNQRRAFTLRQVEGTLMGTIDRVTAYRALKLFLASGIIGKAMNVHGASCFFYLDHFNEHKRTQFYLECTGCQQVYGLPTLPAQYLSILSDYKVSPLPTLLRGLCSDCECGNYTNLVI